MYYQILFLFVFCLFVLKLMYYFILFFIYLFFFQLFILFFIFFIYLFFKSLLIICPTHTKPHGSGLGTRGIKLLLHINAYLHT